MGKWSSDFKNAGEPLIAFGSWKELHAWNDEVNAREECPLLEEQFVLNCYSLYRNGQLNEVISSIYTDGYAGKEFTITAEVSPGEADFDLCSLPLYLGIVDGEEAALYPEEIFVNW